MRLTQHFTLWELSYSAMADTLEIDNTPPAAFIERLRAVAEHLERVRAILGVPIIVKSGYRCRKLNRLVGGVPTSAHALGWAADWRAVGRPDAFEALRQAGSKRLGPFDQLIDEESRGVVHSSIDPRLRGQWLCQPGGPGSPVWQVHDYIRP